MRCLKHYKKKNGKLKRFCILSDNSIKSHDKRVIIYANTIRKLETNIDKLLLLI